MGQSRVFSSIGPMDEGLLVAPGRPYSHVLFWSPWGDRSRESPDREGPRDCLAPGPIDAVPGTFSRFGGTIEGCLRETDSHVLFWSPWGRPIARAPRSRGPQGLFCARADRRCPRKLFSRSRGLSRAASGTFGPPRGRTARELSRGTRGDWRPRDLWSPQGDRQESVRAFGSPRAGGAPACELGREVAPPESRGQVKSDQDRSWTAKA